MLLLAGCGGKESPKTENYGFGIGEYQISAGDARIPVYLRHTEPVKGVEFILSWDSTALELRAPALAPGNESFSIHSRERDGSQMKVLVFSMQGEPLRQSEDGLLYIPVTTVEGFQGTTELNFLQPVFAGENASSYDIPVDNGLISVN
jgi:hypothetical protein